MSAPDNITQLVSNKARQLTLSVASTAVLPLTVATTANMANRRLQRNNTSSLISRSGNKYRKPKVSSGTNMAMTAAMLHDMVLKETPGNLKMTETKAENITGKIMNPGIHLTT